MVSKISDKNADILFGGPPALVEHATAGVLSGFGRTVAQALENSPGGDLSEWALRALLEYPATPTMKDLEAMLVPAGWIDFEFVWPA
jgi:hypothetical protein